MISYIEATWCRESLTLQAQIKFDLEVLSCSGQLASFVWFMLLFMKTMDRFSFKCLVPRWLCTFHNEWSKWTWTSCLLPFPRERNRSKSLEYFYYLSVYLLIIHVLRKGILKACVNTKRAHYCLHFSAGIVATRNTPLWWKNHLQKQLRNFPVPNALDSYKLQSVVVHFRSWFLFIQSVIFVVFFYANFVLGMCWNITATVVFTVLGLV